MDKSTLEKMANLAFTNLTAARQQLFAAAEHTIACTAELEAARTRAITGGVFDGKNAEVREAQAREHLADEYSAVDSASRGERAARHLFDTVSIDVETVKTLLRIAELQ